MENHSSLHHRLKPASFPSKFVRSFSGQSRWVLSVLITFALCVAISMMTLSCSQDDEHIAMREYATAVSLADHNDFLVTGSSNDHVYVARLSTEGNLIWENKIDLGEPCIGRAIAYSGNSVYVLCLPSSPDIQNKAYILRLDSGGQRIASHTITLPIKLIGQIGNYVDNGQFVLTGISSDSANGTACLMKISFDGTMNSFHAYGTHLLGGAAALCNDGGYLIWTRNQHWDSVSVYIRTSSNGDSLWSVTSRNNDYNVYAVQQQLDGTFILAGMTYEGHGVIRTLYSNGNSLWGYSFGDSNAMGAYSIAMSWEGRIYIACCQWTLSLSRLGIYSIINLIPGGNVAWERRCENGESRRVPSNCATNDGGQIIAGSTIITEDGKSNEYIFLAKYSSMSELVWQKRILR